jgi:hypothetical protein
MILDSAYDNDYLNAVRNGTLKQGLEIGCKLDEHLVFKHGSFNVMIGQANVGKTDFIIWYLTALTIKHNLTWLIFSSENRIGGLKQKIIQYWTGKELKDLNRDEYERARNDMSMFFKFIDTNHLYSARDLIEVFEENKQHFEGAIIDPYNSLTKDLTNTNGHEYDYQIASEIRLFCKKYRKTVYIIAHAVTESLRRVHPKDHEYAGYPVPPTAADIEGGGKWVNRADDFVSIHRYTQHPNIWMYTHIHVKKIKETETGGKPTFLDSPVMCKKYYNSFQVEGIDPIKNKIVKEKPLPINTNYEKSVQHAKDTKQDWMDDEPNEILF